MWSSSGRKSHAKWRCRTSGRPQEVQRCRRRKRPRCAHTADVAQAALDIGYSENRGQSVLDHGQTHAQCPLSRIFRRHFRPTIELLAWLSVVMALLPTPLWLREVRPALKKVERAALCWKTRQRVVAYAGIEHNHASSRVCTPCPVRVPSIVACRRIPPFLVNLQLGVNDSLWQNSIFLIVNFIY